MTSAIEVIGLGEAAAAEFAAPRPLAGKALFPRIKPSPFTLSIHLEASLSPKFASSPAQRLTRRDLLPRRLGIVIDARRHEPNRSGLAIPRRQTLHISARLRGPHGDAGSLSIYRLPARRPVFKYSAQCGLMVFFFLSSFLLCHSLASDPNWKARPHLSLITYSINRVFRIFPLLLVVIALTYWNRSSFFPSPVGYWEGLRQSLTLGEAPSVLWTIPVELTFYLYLPIVLALAAAATRSRLGAAILGSVYLAWCIAIAVARHNGGPAALWMTLGFHHYANSFVGGALFYALLTSSQIRFPRCGAWIAWVAPLLFISAYPFVHFALFRSDASMAELARPGAWQSYYDAVFPIAPVVVVGVIYGLLHPSDSPLSRTHANASFAKDRRIELRRLSCPYSDDRLLRFPLWLWPMAILRVDRRDFRRSGGAFGAGRKARNCFRARPGPMGSGGPQGQARSSIAAEREFELMMR